ncbi:crn-1 [Pristionchus pacificus]|uniref:Flap endonuclease 1 n=1 Tax=Pristionchus pacificus TaxID=54126 RepID=A0A2A6C4V4_PRIPA|nr:crn-1 [Pristionchus pacificus]|eukprot:PDM73160.1 crn-1 [Pristionchus pacificus]
MGIKDLSKVIADHAPSAIKEVEMKSFFGRKVAVDASMCLYQFLVAVRSDGSLLQTADGETTSHLMGIFYRTIRMIDNGIKPVYVFDGKPPDMKSGELEKRAQRREDTEKQLKEAEEEGNAEDIQKFERRLVKVTKSHNDEVKQLLRLMGIPVVEAPCEAEAQCAELVSSGKVYGTATEDMDALTFGSNVLLRNMTASEAKKLKVKEINLARVLEGFEMTNEQFVDLCIMLGCDYCGSIRGVGQKKAYELIKKYGTIEAVLENLDTAKYPPPADWPFKRARELFITPDVKKGSEVELVWKEPDVEGVVAFMCGEKAFEETRIRNSLAKMSKGRQAASQGRIDSFFTTQKTVKVETLSTAAARKRKADEKDGKKRGSAKKIK